MRATPLLIPGAAALLLLAGCGTTNVDTGKIERQLQSRVAAEANVDAGDVKADCPSDEKAEAGRSFTCTLTWEKHRRTVVIRLEADDTYSATIRTQATP
jgi:hypothetical protein